MFSMVFTADIVQMFAKGVIDTLWMTFGTTFLSYLIGLPLGVLLIVTARNGLKPRPTFNWVLGLIVNLMRSVPFLIMMIAVLPLVRFLIGTSIGPNAAIIALTFSAAPFVARVVEQSLLEVDRGVIEAAHSMGASPWQIVWKVYLVESYPSLLNGGLLSIVTILGYSAMAGFIGAGGLGDIAIRFGYNRYDLGTMNITIILIVILVQIIQLIGERMSHHSDKRINE